MVDYPREQERPPAWHLPGMLRTRLLTAVPILVMPHLEPGEGRSAVRFGQKSTVPKSRAGKQRTIVRIHAHLPAMVDGRQQ
jgi:hypothetical protein